MIQTIETGLPKVLGVQLSGKLHDEDYKHFTPLVESMLTGEGKVRVFVQFEDFHGWDMHAAWDDFQFGLKHYSDFERIAMVGDRRWEKWMAGICKPFTKAKVRFFEKADIEAAWEWLREEEPHVEEKADARVATPSDVEPPSAWMWHNY
jgi:hypothetical protein